MERHPVAYWRCGTCAFIQTDAPHWLDEAYREPIAREDVGLVARNLQVAETTRLLVGWALDPDGVFLDFAGGYGLLVRLMRDHGLDFRLHDPHTPNLFALHAEVSDISECGRWELVTAFEVLEHLVDPRGELERLLGHTDTILATTSLYPEPGTSAFDDWHYWAPEAGQHISFFHERTFAHLAEALGVRYVGHDRTFHLLTRRRINPVLFRLICSYRTRGLLRWRLALQRRPALDHPPEAR